jgi:hypothetical protein
LVTRGTLRIASDVRTVGEQVHNAKLVMATGEASTDVLNPIVVDDETFIVRQDEQGNDKVYRHVSGVGGEKVFVHEVIVANPSPEVEGDETGEPGENGQPNENLDDTGNIGDTEDSETKILRALYTVSDSGEIVADEAGDNERAIVARAPEVTSAEDTETQTENGDGVDNESGGDTQTGTNNDETPEINQPSLAESLEELEGLGQTLRRYVYDEEKDGYLKLQPAEFTTEDNDIAFNGGISAGTNAKTTRRSVLIDAGTGTVSIAGQVGQNVRDGQSAEADLRDNESRVAWSAFDRQDINPYRFEVIGEQINLNADVTTFEEQIYRSPVSVGSVADANPMRLLVSVDPAIRFLDTIDDANADAPTHSLANYAISSIAEDATGFIRPEINFEGSIGATNPLLHFTAETGVQDIQSEVATIRERSRRANKNLFPGEVGFGEGVQEVNTGGDQIVYGWDITFAADTVRSADGESEYNTGQVLNDDGELGGRGFGGGGAPPPPGDLTPPPGDLTPPPAAGGLSGLGDVAAGDDAPAGVDFELQMARNALERIRGAKPSDSPLLPPNSSATGLLTASVQVGNISTEAAQSSGDDGDGDGIDVDVCVDVDDENCEPE